MTYKERFNAPLQLTALFCRRKPPSAVLGSIRADREIGHGKLAWRAMRHAVLSGSGSLPPTTILWVSEIHRVHGFVLHGDRGAGDLAGAVDPGCNADVAAPLFRVSAMGLIKGSLKAWPVCSDILGDEDASGRHGLSGGSPPKRASPFAGQMDIKIPGLTREIWKPRSIRLMPGAL